MTQIDFNSVNFWMSGLTGLFCFIIGIIFRSRRLRKLERELLQVETELMRRDAEELQSLR
jgi:hypothetical protein